MPRFFAEDENGNAVLISAYDPKTWECTYCNEDFIAKQKEKNMERAGKAASDIVNQDPNSALLSV